jgi:hypothetical protein
LRKSILPLVFVFFLLAACRKEAVDVPLAPVNAPCIAQTSNPSGRTYSSDSIVSYTCTSKHCGLLPLSAKNYWVYEDSIFQNGVFANVQYDTLRFNTSYKSITDGLVWWQGNINIGLPERLYTNDSTFFSIQERYFTQGYVDARKEFGLFTGDSLRYQTSFDDIGAQGKSIKLKSDLTTPAGNFSGCLYFEKYSRFFRKDQVYFKPGLGVIKYVQEMASMGSYTIKLQQVSTLVSYHLE